MEIEKGKQDCKIEAAQMDCKRLEKKLRPIEAAPQAFTDILSLREQKILTVFSVSKIAVQSLGAD